MSLTFGVRAICIALALPLALSPLAMRATAQPLDPRFDTAEEAVHFTFARYRNAVLARDGATAYDCVDSNTRAYYDRIVNHVKFSGEEELRQQSYTDLTIILSSRQFIERSELEGMDGRDLFMHAVNMGWTDRELVLAGVGRVEFNGSSAHAPALLNRVQTLFHWVFHFEDERWRLDLAAQLESIDQTARQMLSAEGMSPADLAYGMLVRGAGDDVVTEDIWKPLFSR